MTNAPTTGARRRALTLIASALVFEALGRSPGLSLYTFFIKPLTSPSSLPSISSSRSSRRPA